MMKIISFRVDDSAHSKTAFEIRRKVFVEEQHVSREEEYDEYEKSSVHYLVYVNEEPIGTARWRKTEKGIKLERFAVLKEHRSSGAGTAVLKKILFDVIPLKEKIYLNAQLAAVDFYLKEGFKVEGDEFTEANIRHLRMNWPEENKG